MWLLNRLFDQGDQPTPRFAFQGTVNWMRALSIYTNGSEFSHDSLRHFYRSIQRRPPNESGDTLALECLTMSMHNVSALVTMEGIDNPYPIVRSAIVSWYYATYYGTKAMLAASSGTDPQTHASAGRIFQSEVVSRGLVKRPFDLNVTNLVPNNIKKEVESIRSGNSHDLNVVPENEEMAFGALCSYLKGTADYEQWRLEEQVKGSSAYKSGGFTNFRSNAAKELRDAKLSPASVNYLIQAFRYRGKANYRDAIYLSYGRDQSDQLNQYLEDLTAVSSAYTFMVSHYIARRILKSDWQFFVDDIETYAQFDLPFELNEI